MEKLESKKVLYHVINRCDVEILNYKCDYVGIQFSKANGYYFLNNELHITYNGGSTGKSLKEIRLILRPLSDLTKEIEHNGEKFVPTQEYDYLRFEEISTLKSGSNALKFIQARELELLYEMNFDIHGLIEKGLAIDINTLSKQP